MTTLVEQGINKKVYCPISGSSKLQSWSNSNMDEFNSIKTWVSEFLCAPHPYLGRSGDVCPFTREAIDKDSIFFTLEKSTRLEKENEIKKITSQIKQFKELKVNNSESYKVIINAYPYLDKDEYLKIEAIQNELKPIFVEESLMIGQFYPGCKERGLWSDKFFPLDSPIAFLAVRNMAITDIVFLRSNELFLQKYLQVFNKRGEVFLKKIMDKNESNN
jgi:hypothetical protein